MNRPLKPLVAAGLGVLIAGWAGWRGAAALYFAPRAELHDDLERRREALRAAGVARARGPEIVAQLQARADRALGADRESVDHELRRQLTLVGQSVELEQLTVSTTRHTPRPTPAKAEFRRRQHREYRDEIDLVEQEASISGEGTFEQVTRLVHRLDAAPWPKRIDSLTLDPDAEGQRFDVTVRLTTYYLPGLSPSAPPGPPAAPGGFDRYVAMVQANPFRVPEAPPPAPVSAPEAPPPFPYGEWVVTGVVKGPDGDEVWLRHHGGETRRLMAGDQVGEAVLRSIDGDEAEFRLGEAVYRVPVGRNLAPPS